MNRLVYGPQEPLKTFIERNIPRCRARGLPQAGKAIGVVNRNAELVGGFYYHDHDPEAGVIEISMAAIVKNWWSRAILFGLLDYPFNQLGCQMIGSRISADDLALRRQLKAFGFSEHLIPRLFGRDADGAICTLTVDAWRGNKFFKKD